MALDVSKTIVPGRGTVLIAPPDTPPVNLATFNIGDPKTYDGWTISYTSKDNLPKFSKDGGDLTSLDAWEADAIETSQAATVISLSFAKIQIDQEGLGLAFPGGIWNEADGSYDISTIGTTEKAIQVIAISGSNKRAGMYMGRATVSIGDMPELDPEKFMELSFNAQLHADGSGRLIRWFPAVAGKVTSAAAPTVTSVLPTTAKVGDTVTLTGTNFGDASGVKFGLTQAQSYTITSPTQVKAVVPAGLSTGDVQVAVTNPRGTSSNVKVTISA